MQEFVWIAKELVLPPGGILLLGLLGLALVGRTFGKLLLLLAWVMLYLLSTPLVAALLAAPLEAYPALEERQLSQNGAGAILLLGGGRYSDAPEYQGDTVGTLLLVRTRYAAWLARRTGLPVIASGGSVLTDGPGEAELARRVLEQEFGVRVLATEANSRTTWENAQLSAALLRRLGIDRVLLVTHAVHMPRAVAVMHNAGVDVVPAPTAFIHKRDDMGVEEWADLLPSAYALWQSRYALHEHLGGLWYRVRTSW